MTINNPWGDSSLITRENAHGCCAPPVYGSTCISTTTPLFYYNFQYATEVQCKLFEQTCKIYREFLDKIVTIQPEIDPLSFSTYYKIDGVNYPRELIEDIKEKYCFKPEDSQKQPHVTFEGKEYSVYELLQKLSEALTVIQEK